MSMLLVSVSMRYITVCILIIYYYLLLNSDCWSSTFPERDLREVLTAPTVSVTRRSFKQIPYNR